MNVLEFSGLLLLSSTSAGLLGAMTGLGGGTVLVPLLTLAFGVDIRYAIGAALISVIATSSGAAAAYVKEGFTNIRVGMFLELATTTGAIAGAAAAAHAPVHALSIMFGVVLFLSSVFSAKPQATKILPDRPDRLATFLKMDSTYPTAEGKQPYHVHNVAGGASLMFVAGILSGLLGIGSGALKVIAMDKLMRMPFKVSTTTSNLMIGVTAAASSGVYLSRGYIDPGLVMPVTLGVLGGSVVGARMLTAAQPKVLKVLFNLLILLMACQMIYNGIRGTAG